MKNLRVWGFLTLANLFWAGNYVFGKYVAVEVPPFWITFFRWVIALLFLFPIAQIVERPRWSEWKHQWAKLAVMGLLGTSGYNLLLYTSLEYTSSTNAALVNALNPALIVLFSVWLLREKVSRLQAAGFFISLIGVFVILVQGNLSRLIHFNFNRGDLIMLLAILDWTFYSIIARKKDRFPPIASTAVSSLLSVLLLLPFTFAVPFHLHGIGTVSFIGIVYMALFPSVGSYILWNLSVQEVGPSQAGISLNLIPVFTAVIAIALGQKLLVSQVVGGILVFVGVYLTVGAVGRRLSLKKNG